MAASSACAASSGGGGGGGGAAAAGSAGDNAVSAGKAGQAGGGGSSVGSAGGPSGGGVSGGAAGSAGAAGNGASSVGGVSMLPWPGTADVVTVDESDFFGTNLSGLSYEPATATSAARLWALQNIPSKLYRLVFDGTNWVADAGAWASGKLLHYPDGKGAPDAEGVTQPDVASPVLYIASEHDNDAAQVSRLSILRLDTSNSSAELSATNEWNVTSDIPATGANLGLEAISFVPDAALVAGGFSDEAKHKIYDPADYPNHAGGLFFVGVEDGGEVYGYALDHSAGSFVRVASFSSGQTGIMDLAYDRDSGFLWGYCDNTCGNKATIFSLVGGGFEITRVYSPPKTLPNTNNEGITFAPSSECSAGQRAFFWTDDDQLDGHCLRRGSIPCGAF